MNTKKKLNVRSLLRDNNVTILFIVLCIGAYFASGTTLNFLLPELFTRIGRNTFMVLSLLIPVVAGLGLNFGIVIGAASAQIAIFLVLLMGVKGLPGLLLCVVICTPLAIFFGYLIGRLFNSMKGTEMIGGLVAGYFSDGLYQLLFLFVLGGIIPIANKTLMISTGVGVKNTMKLGDKAGLKYALDNIPMINILDVLFWGGLVASALILLYRLLKKQPLGIGRILKFFVPVAAIYALSFIPVVGRFLGTNRLLLLNAIELGALVAVIVSVIKIIKMKAIDKKAGLPKKEIMGIVIAALAYGATYIPPLFSAFSVVKLPVMTYVCIAGLVIFTSWFLNTKLGQEMRTVGQNRAVANSAGINVDRVRIIAMIMSTVLASYGQLISLQNIGTVATYGSHQQVGLYAIAALLVGGASVQQANAKQAVLGVVLFHTLFILSPVAGKQLLGNAMIGEYFRVFVAYGVIALSLAMHAWSKLMKGKEAAAKAEAAEAKS
ncbi:simple sugar transport system permease protein [Lachnospiraceae bacterium PF1-22]|uniref:ABC transporter permease subunit n=1 Tax=Ohessyouella blattaphilus TaxID=2949333 RepID=UPI0025651ED5|nr:ABC transporter permease [Lachnospiraceae bacterium OttesenSCG-928-J05]